jgi:hypothetical protein
MVESLGGEHKPTAQWHTAGFCVRATVRAKKGGCCVSSSRPPYKLRPTRVPQRPWSNPRAFLCSLCSILIASRGVLIYALMIRNYGGDRAAKNCKRWLTARMGRVPGCRNLARMRVGPIRVGMNESADQNPPESWQCGAYSRYLWQPRFVARGSSSPTGACRSSQPKRSSSAGIIDTQAKIDRSR